MLFEIGGQVSAFECSQMSGNPVRIRDGCATVAGYELPQATDREIGKAGVRLGPESGYRFDCARRGRGSVGL